MNKYNSRYRGIATADVLGTFGKYGVYIATCWGSSSYINAASICTMLAH